MNNDPNLYEGQKLVKDANGFFMKMYGYMAAAVGISAVTAFMAANVPSVVSLVSNGLVMSILFIMQLVLVFRMSSLKAIRTSGKALSSLIFYSMIEGLFLSGLLYKYTAMDITRRGRSRQTRWTECPYRTRRPPSRGRRAPCAPRGRGSSARPSPWRTPPRPRSAPRPPPSHA